MAARLVGIDSAGLPVRALKALVAVVLALSLFLALVVPYHATDALVYGSLSRAIADSGGFLHDQVGYPPHARPLFYVPQGWMWWVVGVQEWLGRLFSLAFFAALVWALHRLARRIGGRGPLPWVVLVVALASPDLVTQAFAGQTDVPVAATLALVAAGLWTTPASRRGAALIALAALAAVLAKATALPALAGLALAALLGPRDALRERLALRAAPVVAGTGLGLVYAWAMARHFGLRLDEFLGGKSETVAAGDPLAGRLGTGAGGVATAPAPANSPSVLDRLKDAVDGFFGGQGGDALLRADWLGPYLRLLLIFAVAFAVLRVLRVSHRAAVAVALAVALAGYWLASRFVEGAVSPLDTGAGAVLLSMAMVVALAGVAWAPAEHRLPVLWHARLLLWTLPPLLAWGAFGILTDTRTLSPAWPALFVLVGAVVAMGARGLATRAPALAAGVLVVVLAMGVLDLRNLDGLGARPDGSVSAFRALPKLTPGTWLHPSEARSVADPQFGGIVAGSRDAAGRGRLWTNDGRLIFFFLGRIAVAQPPASCDRLRGYAALSVLLNTFGPKERAALGRLRPCLRQVRGEPGSYAVFRVV